MLIFHQFSDIPKTVSVDFTNTIETSLYDIYCSPPTVKGSSLTAKGLALLLFSLAKLEYPWKPIYRGEGNDSGRKRSYSYGSLSCETRPIGTIISPTLSMGVSMNGSGGEGTLSESMICETETFSIESFVLNSIALFADG